MSIDEKVRRAVRSKAVWRLSVLTVGCLAAAVGGLVSIFHPHVPAIHDEFSILLAADTILQGRLANPTPSLWQPLQSFHVILEPSYASKYPLGAGVLAAVGELLGGAIFGSRLAAGFCCICVCWMLAGIVPKRWALFGGLLVALHPTMQTTWSQSLISGWLIAAASAAVLGGVLRLRRRIELSSALVAGLGVGMLALSRPFEGAVFVCCNAMWLLSMWQIPVRQKLVRSARCLFYAAAPVLIAFGLTAWQNQATTHSLFQMPYQVHEQSYGVAPLFVFGHQKTPDMMASGAVSPIIEEFHYGWSLDSFEERRGLQGWLLGIPRVLDVMGGYWGISFIVLPLLTAWAWLPYRLGRVTVAAFAPQVLASAAVCWIFPHYLAPLLPCLVLLTVVGLRRALHRWRRFYPELRDVAKRVPSALVACQILMLVIAVVRFHQESPRPWAVARNSVHETLLDRPGKDLVIVEYGREHNPHEEWVYNAADIEGSEVIWARGSREDWKRQLIDRYAQQRRVWILRPEISHDLIPFSPDGDHTFADAAADESTSLSDSREQHLISTDK